MLTLYRSALRLRRDLLGDGTRTWLPPGGDVLAFRRDSGLVCVSNLGSVPVPLPPGELLLTSGPVEGGALPPDTTAWVAG
ncbi:DUF3459 domain-containing protein [Nonomuraea sp. NPDC050691]|uniref:DUF3459 domain-containing protein n=1 Tax=Nonomuraea sp. NPDC050691 TaxID=3155661 RepID=UPI0033EFB011